ncbi:unnamed protein product [Arabidopsis thaliana]|uniref:Uncharacterized protein n=1 Tax=Arabidopsis thaliana TaxID=3702 RepID=A0A5S9XQF6_ARATH|nr:unnamed protein product [Arabidopsis thaliana]
MRVSNKIDALTTEPESQTIQRIFLLLAATLRVARNFFFFYTISLLWVAVRRDVGVGFGQRNRANQIDSKNASGTKLAGISARTSFQETHPEPVTVIPQMHIRLGC